MTDVERQKLRGPVRTVTKEIADWDESAGAWKPARLSTRSAFDADGRTIEVDHHGPEGSRSRSTYVYDDSGRLIDVEWRMADGAVSSRQSHTYDAEGRLVRVTHLTADGVERDLETHRYGSAGRKWTTRYLPPEEPDIGLAAAIEGSEMCYGAHGAVVVVTAFDERGLATGGVFQDASGRAVREITLTRDEQGRVVSEEATIPADAAPAQIPGGCESMSADERATLVDLFRMAFDVMSTAYEYDSRGRVVERRRRTGLLSEEQTTFRYDENDNVVEQSEQQSRRDIGLDEDGNLKRQEQPRRVSDLRFEYTYDEHGNWTERVVWQRFEPGAEFRRTNTGRRRITYY